MSAKSSPAMFDDSAEEAELERLMAMLRGAGVAGAGAGAGSPFGYAGWIVLVCTLSIVLAWPCAFAAGLSWHLAQAGWAVFS